jgi:hypothetical protein
MSAYIPSGSWAGGAPGGGVSPAREHQADQPHGRAKKHQLQNAGEVDWRAAELTHKQPGDHCIRDGTPLDLSDGLCFHRLWMYAYHCCVAHAPPDNMKAKFVQAASCSVSRIKAKAEVWNAGTAKETPASAE